MAATLPGRVVLGVTDCEQVRDGLLAQPVEALTSLGYVVAGGWLVWHLRDAPSVQRWSATAYGGLLAAVGAGSFVYHGPQQVPGAELMHDVPIALVVVQAVVVPLGRLVTRRPALRPVPRRTLATLAGLGGLAAVAYAAGRTGSPLCEPASLWQAHGLWHLAGAVGLTLWGTMLWPAPAVRSHEPSTA